MNKVWTPTEKEYIRLNAATKKDKDIAAHLSVTSNRKISLQAVRKQRQKMGLAKQAGRGKCGLKRDEVKVVVTNPLQTTPELVSAGNDV